MMMHHKQRGLTLIEIMVTVAILGILAMLVIPSYSKYIREARRSEAMSTLMNMQMAEEKYRANNSTYGDLDDVWAGVTATNGGWYNLAIAGNTATAYTITATAQNDQRNDTEEGGSCTTLTITVNGIAVTKAPSACW